MYRRNSSSYVAKYFDFLILDTIVSQLAFVIAYWVRSGFGNPYAVDIYQDLAITVLLINLLVVSIGNMYKDVLFRGSLVELQFCVKQFILLELIGTAMLFFMKIGEDYSRIIVMTTGVLVMVLNFVFRIIYKRIVRKIRSKRASKSIVLFVREKNAEEIIRSFEKNNYDFLWIKGLVVWDRDMKGESLFGYPVIANISDAAEMISKDWVDEVYVRIPYGEAYPHDLLCNLAVMGITVHQDLQELNVISGESTFWEKKGGYHVLTTTIGVMTGLETILKRLMDIVGGIVGCALTGLVYLLIAPKIKRESPGPVFFTQTRIGKNGKQFKMYKFRSMYLDAEERKKELMDQNRVKDGMMFKLDYDPRIIGCKKLPDGTIQKGIGNKIRDWSIDEFPQFWNVLKGDMSLVGTRPPTLDEWEKYEFHHRARMATRPGITGMWQTSGRSNITDFEEVVRLDTEYIANWSIGLDLKIILKTVKVALKKEGSM